MTPVEEFQSSPEKALVVLNGLSIATKTFRLYPNPLEQAAFGRAMNMVRQGIVDGPSIRMHVLPDRFSIAGNEFGSDQEAIAELASWLFERGVTELHIRGEPRPSELVAFAELVSAEAHEVEAKGGPKAFLTQRETTAIHVVDRKLTVGEFSPALRSIPERLRSLLENQLELAGEIAAGSSPNEAYEKLRELLNAGIQLGLEQSGLNSGIADVVASMEPEYRAELLEIAIGALPDEFGSLIVSQLSDGEITEALLSLTSRRPIDLIMAMAHGVVEHSGGRRAELPIIVGKRVLESGVDSRFVNLVVRSVPTETLRLDDAEAELELEDLRAEAKVLEAAVDEDAGMATLQGVLRSSEQEQDLEETLNLIVEAIERAIEDGNRDRYARLLELLTLEATESSDKARKSRVEDAISRAATTELVKGLLTVPSPESDPFTTRVFGLVGGRVVPALVSLLADEVDRTRRKALIEMLVATAPDNPGPVIEGLSDSRWYVVRNFAMILGRIKASEAVPALERLMQFGDPRVRREAVRAGASAKGAAALSSLIQTLSDADEFVRLRSIAAIGAIQDAKSTEALIQFASRRNRSLAEMKEVLTSLRFQRNQKADDYLKRIAQRWWPPTSATRQLAKFSRELLQRSVTSTEGFDSEDSDLE